MGGIAVAELAEVAPPRAGLEVVMAEVGLAEAALVGLAGLEVAGQAAAAELAAAKAKRQLVLHRRSCSFYMEARTRYHRIAQSLFFVDCQLIFFALLLLVSFTLLTKGVRQTLFKERVAAAISRKQGYQSLYRKRSRSVSSNSRLYFRLLVNGSEIPMCGNAYRNLFLLR